MSNGFQEGAQGGIKFSTPIFSFGNTTPAINGGYSFDLPMATIQSFANNALTFTQNNASSNKDFLNSVIGRSQQQVSTSVNEGFGFIGGVNEQMASTVKKATSKRTSGCFITTAICQEDGKPDDCEELTTLRYFRDSYMQSSPARKRAVEMYYDIAPDIVSFIDARSDSHAVYATLKTAYLLPALAAIKCGDFEGAFHIYADMVSAARIFAAEVEHG